MTLEQVLRCQMTCVYCICVGVCGRRQKCKMLTLSRRVKVKAKNLPENQQILLFLFLILGGVFIYYSSNQTKEGICINKTRYF